MPNVTSNCSGRFNWLFLEQCHCEKTEGQNMLWRRWNWQNHGTQFGEGSHKLFKVISPCSIISFRGCSEGVIVDVNYYWGEGFQAFLSAKSRERFVHAFERSFVFLYDFQKGNGFSIKLIICCTSSSLSQPPEDNHSGILPRDRSSAEMLLRDLMW